MLCSQPPLPHHGTTAHCFPCLPCWADTKSERTGAATANQLPTMLTGSRKGAHMAQSQDLDCAPHSPLGQCSVVLDRACPVVSSTQPLPEGVQRQPALPGNERSSVDRGASTPPAEAVEETVKGALIPSPTPRLKKRTYDTERRGMTWHAADMPLPAGAVQAFSTLEAEPPCVRPHSPCPGTQRCFSCQCSAPAPEPTFSTLPSQTQPSFQHCSTALPCQRH